MFLALGSCRTEEGVLLLTEEPVIELIEVTPASYQVQQYVDELVFTISFSDGDGDLGTDDPDIPSIELVDTRDPSVLTFEYHLPPRTPAGSEIKIIGQLNIILDHTILIDENNDSETTTFKIKIKDRAGNWSNEVETPEITINK